MIVLGVVLVVAYAVGVRRLADRGRQWPLSRTVPFAIGMGTLLVAAMVPVRSFTSHMVEHVLLGMAFPVLLALSAPITLALQSASAPTRLTVRRVLHHPLVRTLAQPMVGWLVFGGSMVAFYFSPLLDLSARNDTVDALVHVHFIAAGALFVWPLLGIDPVPTRVPFGGRLLAILVAVPFHAFLGLAMLSASSAFAPDAYPSVSDQRTAAGLLMGSGELFTFAVAAVVFFRWAAADRREGIRFDRSVDRGQQLPGEIVIGLTGDD